MNYKTAITPEWCLNMARLEEGQEIGAGALDHPLRLTMNDKTYADGIEDAAGIEADSDYNLLMEAAHRLEGPHEWGYRDIADGSFIADATPFAAASSLRMFARSLTPTASEATAIGAGEALSDGEIYSRASFDSLDHKRGFLEGLRFAVSPKPDTNTSVDPGVEGVRQAASKAASDEMRRQGFSGGWDHDALIDAILATIDHPIARSGMRIGEGVTDAMIDAGARQYYKDYEGTTDERVADVFGGDWSCYGEDTEWQRTDTVREMREAATSILRAALSPQQDQSR